MTDSLPSTPSDWTTLSLSQDALDLVAKAGFQSPTPVQKECIPLALAGNDLIASAQTGTGKTAAFVLPMVERFAKRAGTYGLVLSPTREIALQTHAAFGIFGVPRGVHSIALIGGIPLAEDLKALHTYPQVIVATPGRLCDQLERGNIWLNYIEVLVLDEADRMLDMGFTEQLSRIVSELPQSRQTLLFSATISPPVETLARRILKDPKKICIGKPLGAARSVELSLRWMREEDKQRELLLLIAREKGTIIVFTRSKDGATRLWRGLHSRNVYDATILHSDRAQAQREQALAYFKDGRYRILIATDVAGRGIHVEDVAHVVNYDLPMEPEDFIHRIGRTGRVGALGRATTFVTTRDRRMLSQIENLLGHKILAENAEPAHHRSDGDDSKRHSSFRGGRRKRR